MLDFYVRKFIDKTLARNVTQPEEVYVHGLSETDLQDRRELSRAYVDFANLIEGVDHPKPGRKNIVRTATVTQVFVHGALQGRGVLTLMIGTRR